MLATLLCWILDKRFPDRIGERRRARGTAAEQRQAEQPAPSSSEEEDRREEEEEEEERGRWLGRHVIEAVAGQVEG